MSSLAALTSVIDPVFSRTKQEHRDNKNQRKQKPRHCRPIRHILEGKERLIQIKIKKHRRATRATRAIINNQRHQEKLEQANDA